MKRIIVALVALWVGALSVWAQIPELKPLKNLDEALVPAMKKDKWGYADGKGKMVIKAVFDAAENFFPVTSPEGTTMDVARVSVDGKWGYITRENVYLLMPEYDTVSVFDNNALVVAVMGPTKMLVGVRSMLSPRIPVNVLTSNVLQVNLTELEPFNEKGVAWAQRAGKWGMLNTKGEWVLPCEYDSWKEDVTFGFYRVTLGGKTGLVLRDATLALAPEWDAIDLYYDSGNYLVKKEGKIGVLYPDGSTLMEPVFDDLVLDVERGYIVKQGDFWGRYDFDGSVIYPCKFHEIPDPDNKGFVEIVRNGIPMIFIAGDQLYTVKDYDDKLYREVGGQGYMDATIIPDWLKAHLVLNPSYVTLEGGLPEPRVMPAEFDGTAEQCATIRFKCGVTLADIVLQDEFESIDPLVKVWDLGSKVYVLLHAVEEYYVFYVYDAISRKTRTYGVTGDMVCLPELGILADTGVWGEAPLAEFTPMLFPEKAAITCFPILRYSFHSWAGVPFVAIGSSAEGLSGMKAVKEGETVPVGKIATGASDMFCEFFAHVRNVSDNGIAMYELIAVDHIYSVSGDLVAMDPVTVAYGYIGLECPFFTQPLFYEARDFRENSAGVAVGESWLMATPDELKLLDPFVQPAL